MLTQRRKILRLYIADVLIISTLFLAQNANLVAGRSENEQARDAGKDNHQDRVDAREIDDAE